MNAKNLIAAVTVLAAAGSSFAGEITPWPQADNFRSTKSRADVVAEMKEAQANGTYVVGGTEQLELVPVLARGAAVAPAASQGKTRAEVYQEMLRARQEGSYVVGGSELEEAPVRRLRATQHAGTGNSVNNAITQ